MVIKMFFLIDLQMIDTKNGESYDGLLVGCDNYMNMKLNDVIITSSDGVFNKS